MPGNSMSGRRPLPPRVVSPKVTMRDKPPRDLTEPFEREEWLKYRRLLVKHGTLEQAHLPMLELLAVVSARRRRMRAVRLTQGSTLQGREHPASAIERAAEATLRKLYWAFGLAGVPQGVSTTHEEDDTDAFLYGPLRVVPPTR